MIASMTNGWRTIIEAGEEKRIKFVTGFREGKVFNAEQIQDESFPALPKPDDTELDTVTGYERAHAIYDAWQALTWVRERVT